MSRQITRLKKLRVRLVPHPVHGEMTWKCSSPFCSAWGHTPLAAIKLHNTVLPHTIYKGFA